MTRRFPNGATLLIVRSQKKKELALASGAPAVIVASPNTIAVTAFMIAFMFVSSFGSSCPVVSLSFASDNLGFAAVERFVLTFSREDGFRGNAEMSGDVTLFF